MSPCKLCHGPLATTPAAGQVHCHANCLPFACPTCVSSNKPSFAILNLSNHIYDYACTECMASDVGPRTSTTVTVTKAHTAGESHAIC